MSGVNTATTVLILGNCWVNVVVPRHQDYKLQADARPIEVVDLDNERINELLTKSANAGFFFVLNKILEHLKK